MNDLNKIARTILWLARIWGSLILGFVLFFLITHFFSNEATAGFKDSKDVLAFICFPVITIIGLAIAFKWPGVGGLVAMLALITGIIFFQITTDLKFILLIYSPAVLYLIYWKLSAKNRQIERRMKLH